MTEFEYWFSTLGTLVPGPQAAYNGGPETGSDITYLGQHPKITMLYMEEDAVQKTMYLVVGPNLLCAAKDPKEDFWRTMFHSELLFQGFKSGNILDNEKIWKSIALSSLSHFMSFELPLEIKTIGLTVTTYGFIRDYRIPDRTVWTIPTYTGGRNEAISIYAPSEGAKQWLLKKGELFLPILTVSV